MAFVEIDGELWDDETGEFAGPVDATLPVDGLHNESDLLAYMRRLMRYEAEVASVQAELDAIIANAQTLVKRKQAKVEWLKRRYQTDATLIAEKLLPRKPDGSYRLKTYTCPFGEVKFTSRRDAVEVESEESALAWAEQHVPDAIKVEKKVLVSKLPSADWLQDGRCPTGFSIRPGTTAVTFTTVK